jgi:hypothetical protein
VTAERARETAPSLFVGYGVKARALPADRGVVTVSQPVRIVVLVGLLAALAGGGLVALKMSHHTAVPTAAKPVVTAPVTHPTTTPAPAPAPARPALHLDPSLPPPVRDALEHSRTAVVLVYSRSSTTDLTLRAAVAAGAQQAGVPFVPLDVDSNSVAAAVFGWTSKAADPETFVVRRPGTIALTLLGMTASKTVAETVASAR